MPTPVEFLNSVGERLLNAGAIQSYKSPTGTTFTVTSTEDVTLAIEYRHDSNAHVLTFTSGVCIGLQVNLRASIRPSIRIIGGRTVEETDVATEHVLDFVQKHFGCRPRNMI